MRTHIFDVEVKNFLHERWCHSDHHDVTPVLAERPDHNHPDIPKSIAISQQIYSVKSVMLSFNILYKFTQKYMFADICFVQPCLSNVHSSAVLNIPLPVPQHGNVHLLQSIYSFTLSS